jgi:hypothetical protein
MCGGWLHIGSSMSKLRAAKTLFAAIILLLIAVPPANGQANLPIYIDHLVNGFQDWSWATRNLSNTSPLHSGTNSISVSASIGGGISFHQTDFDTSVYTNFSFWAHGGAAGGQLLKVYVSLGTTDQTAYNLPSALTANTWQQFVIPLSTLHAANKTNLARLTIQLAGGSTGTYYLDDLQLAASPAPAVVNISVSATQTIRSADARWFGVNTATWDSVLNTSQTISLLGEMGAMVLRWPGGSTSDGYHWTVSDFSKFVHVATNIGAQTFITVNYGSGTASEAAAWVAHANVTNHYGFKYWEIGNENYGTWETDINTNAPYRTNDAWTYAMRAQDYIQQMKAADPTIKVGIVLTPGEDAYVNGYTNHPATNSLTGQIHYGWTPVLLATLKRLGVTPDFAVDHRYPQYTGPGFLPTCPDSDPLLLQSARAWADDAADLRRQITAYFGAGGTNIELVTTENNNDAGQQGKQSLSLVNALYYTESLAQLMKTEFNAFLWWDLHNGTINNGSIDTSLYGWRLFGDFGLLSNGGTRYPTFYAAKLMQYFVRPGDTILRAASDYQLLSVYASRRASGALSLLVVNRDTTANFNAQVALNDFVPAPDASLRFFGIPQDEASHTNGTTAARDIALTNFPGAATSFAYNFPPLSLTLFNFAPTAPTLSALSPPPQPGQFVFQLQGQSGVRYYIQNSTDMSTWTTVATNTLNGITLNITNAAPAGTEKQFWRALWQP